MCPYQELDSWIVSTTNNLNVKVRTWVCEHACLAISNKNKHRLRIGYVFI